jgi:hypothetical protein
VVTRRRIPPKGTLTSVVEGQNCQRLNILHYRLLGILTTLEDLDLLGRSVSQKGTRLEHLQVFVAGVGDQGLDLSVADHFELDIERLGASGDRHSTGQRGEKRNAGEELHLGK